MIISAVMTDMHGVHKGSMDSNSSNGSQFQKHQTQHRYTNGVALNGFGGLNVHRLKQSVTGTESSSSSSCGDRDWNSNFELENALEGVVDSMVNGMGSDKEEDVNCNLIEEAMASRRIGDYAYSAYSQFNMCYDEPRSLILQMSGMLKQRRDYLTEHDMAEEPVLLHFLVTVAVSKEKRSHVASLYLVNDVKDPKKLVAHVQVPSSDYAAEIVGKGGEKVKTMRHEFGVYIKSPARTETPSLFMLSGPCENVVSCVAHLTKCVEHFYQIRRKGLSMKSSDSVFSLSDSATDGTFQAPRFQTERRTPINTEFPFPSMPYTNGSNGGTALSNITNPRCGSGLSSVKRTAILQVEKDLVGLLVGPHGATILSIKSKVNEFMAGFAGINSQQADIMTPKMGAESCFTITGSAEQIKLVKEVMCVYIVERDPSRSWPDQSVSYSPEAKTIVDAIVEEQKQRERGGSTSSTGKSRNGSGGSIGSPLLSSMLGRINGLNNAFVGFNVTGCLDGVSTARTQISKGSPLNGCSNDVQANLQDSLTQENMAGWSNWTNYNNYCRNITSDGSLNSLSGMDSMNLNQHVETTNGTNSGHFSTIDSTLMFGASASISNKEPPPFRLAPIPTSISACSDTWSVTPADTWTTNLPLRQMHNSSLPELHKKCNNISSTAWEQVCHSNEETRRNSQDDSEFRHLTSETIAKLTPDCVKSKVAALAAMAIQQQNRHLPIAARAPGHGRPANQSPLLGQSRLMGGFTGINNSDLQLLADNMVSGMMFCKE